MIDPELGCQLGHSLPPLVAGRVSGEIELRVSKIVLNANQTNSSSKDHPDVPVAVNGTMPTQSPTATATAFLRKSHTVDIRCRWWGDPGAGSLFTPRVYQNTKDEEQGLLPVTPANRIVFPLHSRWERMRSYFSDADQEGVIFDVIDPTTHLVTGCARFNTSILDVAVTAPTSLKRNGGGRGGRGTSDLVPLSLSRAIPIRLPPSSGNTGQRHQPNQGDSKHGDNVGGSDKNDDKNDDDTTDDTLGAIVGHLHLKVIVRTGALSIVKRVLEDNAAAAVERGGSPRYRKRGGNTARGGGDGRIPRGSAASSSMAAGRNEERRAISHTTLLRGQELKQQGGRDATTLMLPSMLSSFQLNEVLAENDTSSILERFPPSSTEHYNPLIGEEEDEGVDALLRRRRQRHPAAVATSWSDARPLFAAADIFNRETSNDDIPMNNNSSSINNINNNNNNNDPFGTTDHHAQMLPPPPPPPGSPGFPPANDSKPPQQVTTPVSSTRRGRGVEKQHSAGQSRAPDPGSPIAVGAETEEPKEDLMEELQHGLPMPTPPRISKKMPLNTLDDVLKRGQQLRRLMSNAVLTYEHPPLDANTTPSTEHHHVHRLLQDGNGNGNTATQTTVVPSADLSLDELLVHVEQNLLKKTGGGDAQGKRTAQYGHSIAAGVPLDSIVSLSPEFNDRTLTGAQLEELVELTRPATEEMERLTSPYPSLEALHEGLHQMLKHAQTITIDLDRLVVLPSRNTAATTQRPFRPEERNWKIEYNVVDVVSGSEGAGSEDGGSVVSCASLASDRTEADVLIRRPRSSMKKKSKTDATVDIHFRAPKNTEGNTNNTAENSIEERAHTMRINFDNSLVARWSNGGTVTLRVYVSRIQKSSLSKIPGLVPDPEDVKRQAAYKLWGTCALPLRTLMGDESMTASMALPVTTGDASTIRGFVDVNVSTTFDPKYMSWMEERVSSRRNGGGENKERGTEKHIGNEEKMESSVRIEQKEMDNSSSSRVPTIEMTSVPPTTPPTVVEEEEVDEEVEEEEENVTKARMLVKVELFVPLSSSSTEASTASSASTLHVIHRPWQCSHPNTRGTSVMWIEECDGSSGSVGDGTVFDHRSLSTIHLVDDGQHCWSNNYIFEIWSSSDKEDANPRNAERARRLIGLAKVPMSALAEGFPNKNGSSSGTFSGIRTVWNGSSPVVDVLNGDGNCVVGHLKGSIVVGGADSMDEHVEEEIDGATSPVVQRQQQNESDVDVGLMVVGSSPSSKREQHQQHQHDTTLPYANTNSNNGVGYVRHEYTIKLMSLPSYARSNNSNNPIFVKYAFPSPSVGMEDEGFVNQETTLWCQNDNQRGMEDNEKDLSTAVHVLRLLPPPSNLHRYLHEHNKGEGGHLRLNIWQWSNEGGERCECIGTASLPLTALADMTALSGAPSSPRSPRHKSKGNSAEIFQLEVEPMENSGGADEDVAKNNETLALAVYYTRLEIKEGDDSDNRSDASDASDDNDRYTADQDNKDGNTRTSITLSSTTTTTQSAVPRSPCIAVRVSRANVLEAMESYGTRQGQRQPRPYAIRLTTPDGQEHVAPKYHYLIETNDEESGRPIKTLNAIHFTHYWSFPLHTLSNLIDATMRVDVVMMAMEEGGGDVVVGTTTVPLDAMFNSNGMVMGGWHDILAPPTDTEQEEEEGIVGELKIDLMLASAPVQEQETASEVEPEMEPEVEPEMEPEEDDDEDRYDGGTPSPPRYSPSRRPFTTEDSSGIGNGTAYQTYTDYMTGGDQFHEVVNNDDNLLDQSIMSDDSLEDEEIEFVEDVDAKLVATVGNNVQNQSGASSPPPQQHWGSIEVSIVQGIHLATTVSKEARVPQMYVSYRWDIMSPVVSTPLVRPQENSSNSKVQWDHTRLVSIPRTDITLPALSQKVVLCSVWERPEWTQTMFEPSNNDPTSMLMTNDGAVAGSTLPGDRLIGVCRIPLASLSRSMPIIDGWYNVYNSGQSLSGQLRVKIAPDLNVEIEQSTEGTRKSQAEQDRSGLIPPTSPLSANAVAYEYKYDQAEDTTTHTATNPSSSTTTTILNTSSSLGLLKGVLKDLDDVQMRLRSSIGSNNRKRQPVNPGGTIDASASNYHSTTFLSTANVVPLHLRPVTTGMSSSPNNWLNSRPPTTPALYNRNRIVSGASDYSDDFEGTDNGTDNMSQYSDDTFEAASSRAVSRRGSFDDENYDDDTFLQESQLEFESSVIENYDEDGFEKEDDEASPVLDQPRPVKDDSMPVVLSGAFPSPQSSTASTHQTDLPEVTDPYILFLVSQANKEKNRQQQRQQWHQSPTEQQSTVGSVNGMASVSAASTTLGATDGAASSSLSLPMMTVWDNGTSVQIPMEEFMATQPASFGYDDEVETDPDLNYNSLASGGTQPPLTASFGATGEQEKEQVLETPVSTRNTENDADVVDSEMKMASAMATQMVAGPLGAMDGAGFDLVHSLMEQMLQSSVQVDNVGEETDLSKFQDADAVSQLPCDLPGAMLCSSDESEDDEPVRYQQKDRKEVPPVPVSAATLLTSNMLPDVTDPYILNLVQKAEQKKKKGREDHQHGGSNEMFTATENMDLMGKMLGSMSDLHSDLWENALGNEDSGVSSTPDRPFIISTPSADSNSGSSSGSVGARRHLATSPLSATTQAEMSSLTDEERIPMDRIARIMRGNNNNFHSSITSSITSSVWSSVEEEVEEEEDVELIELAN